MRLAIVDTLASMLFFTAVAGVSEAIIAGMPLETVLVTRLIMLPVIAVTGRPYGLWRDRFFTAFKPSRFMSIIALDIFAFLTFQVPVYVATLWVAGATVTEIAKAVGSAIVLMIALGRPFGIYIEFVRKRFCTIVPN